MSPMYIYRLAREEGGWDEMLECVVRASGPEEARAIAAAWSCDEGPEPWRQVKPFLIGTATEESSAGLVMRNVLNG